MLIHIVQGQKQGRTYIIFAATPQSPETRALLAQFKKGVRTVEKKWKAAAARAKKRQAAKGRKRSR
ncbi:MAG TPA: hypothetical protein VMC04_02980 [Verrucomicrobiae bacterium]|jgi:hypothetical protein|nr:hypothetical protein [Verrucomicrobiae bacterium]